MSLQTPNFIFYVRYGLKLSGKVCYEHKLPDDVLGTFVGYLLNSTLSVAELATTDLDQNDDDPLSL